MSVYLNVNPTAEATGNVNYLNTPENWAAIGIVGIGLAALVALSVITVPLALLFLGLFLAADYLIAYIIPNGLNQGVQTLENDIANALNNLGITNPATQTLIFYILIILILGGLGYGLYEVLK